MMQEWYVELMLENPFGGRHCSDYVILVGQGVPLPRIDGGLWLLSFESCQAAQGWQSYPVFPTEPYNGMESERPKQEPLKLFNVGASAQVHVVPVLTLVL
jgi:hypothetical protein